MCIGIRCNAGGFGGAHMSFIETITDKNALRVRFTDFTKYTTCLAWNHDYTLVVALVDVYFSIDFFQTSGNLANNAACKAALIFGFFRRTEPGYGAGIAAAGNDDRRRNCFGGN